MTSDQLLNDVPFPMDPWPLPQKVQKSLLLVITLCLRRYDWIPRARSLGTHVFITDKTQVRLDRGFMVKSWFNQFTRDKSQDDLPRKVQPRHGGLHHPGMFSVAEWQIWGSPWPLAFSGTKDGKG